MGRIRTRSSSRKLNLTRIKALLPGRQVIATNHSRDFLFSPGISGEEIATLRSGQNGTDVQIASSDEQLRVLLETGMAFVVEDLRQGAVLRRVSMISPDRRNCVAG
jgi:hypothetical protein